MRKQAKPVSGNVSSRRGRPTNLQLQFQQRQQQTANNTQNNLNDTFVVDGRPNTANTNNQGMATPTGKRMIPSPRHNTRSPAVSKRAKQKWEIFDRKVTANPAKKKQN